MNEQEVRAELKRLAAASPAGPARLDIDEVLRHGRRRRRRRRAGVLHVSVVAAALIAASLIGVIRLTSDQFSGPARPGVPTLQIPEAGSGMNPANRQWVVGAPHPSRP
jgi:hypothetical protein